MSTTPDSVHPDHDRPTPANIDDWTQDQLDAFNRAQKAKFQSKADEQGRLSDDQEAALDILRDPETEEMAEVTLGDATVRVKTYTPEHIERQLEAIDRDRDNLDTYRETIPEVMAWFIDTDEYADVQVWREYGRRYGVDELTKVFLRVIEPKMERADGDEVVQKFRDRAGRDSVSRRQ